MSKDLLIKAIAEVNPGLTIARSSAIAAAVLASISRQIVKDGGFSLPGVGSLTVVKRAARDGFNPRTQEAIKIPARKVLRFKASSIINGTLNKPAKKQADKSVKKTVK